MEQANDSLKRPQNSISQKDLDFLEDYIRLFMNSRLEDFYEFYRYACQNRRRDIYPLKKGCSLMDFIEDVEGNIGYHLVVDYEGGEKLVPSRFASPYMLYVWLVNFQTFLKDRLNLIDANKTNLGAMQDLSVFITFVYDLIEMIEHVRLIFDESIGFVLLLQMKRYLEQGDIESFVNNLKSLLASIPYNLTAGNKGNQGIGLSEGYFHGLIHVILSLLGFRPHSEDTTNKGRVDMYIELRDCVYILEFKYDNGSEDLSEKALNQINEKKYYEKFETYDKEICLLGVSFSGTERNINGYKCQYKTNKE